MPCLLTLKKACVSIQTPFIIEVYEIHYAPKNEKMLPWLQCLVNGISWDFFDQKNIYIYSWLYQCLQIYIVIIAGFTNVYICLPPAIHKIPCMSEKWDGWVAIGHLGPRTKPFRLSRSELLDWCTVESTVSMERPNLGTLGTRDGCDRKKTMGSGTTCRETIW